MKIKILLRTFFSLGAIFGLVALAHAQNLYVSVNGPLGPSNSNGSISEYTPTGVQTTFASGIPRPRGLAFDAVGNLDAAISALVDDHCERHLFPSRVIAPQHLGDEHVVD